MESYGADSQSYEPYAIPNSHFFAPFFPRKKVGKRPLFLISTVGRRVADRGCKRLSGS